MDGGDKIIYSLVVLFYEKTLSIIEGVCYNFHIVIGRRVIVTVYESLDGTAEITSVVDE